jgi:dTDP-4-amino-4,6-dideoxygalactose transaminase
VITTPLTFCATVNTILQVGATPVLADIGEDGNIDPEAVEKAVTPRTKAILPVHWSGLPCDMDRIWDLAKRFGLYVVEDAAHAVGAHYKGFPIGCGNPDTGSRSDAVVFSFYATKNLTTGEGGMVTTHNEQLLDKMKILCLHGISKDAWNRYSKGGSWQYQVVDCGFKYNLSDIQSAIGIHQLARQEEFVRQRTELVRFYNESFAGVEEYELPAEAADRRHAWHLYVLRLRLEKWQIDRKTFISELDSMGVATSVHFIPIPLHPAYRDLAARPGNHCPKALALYERIVSLPLYPAMTPEERAYVVEAVKTLARRRTALATA